LQLPQASEARSCDDSTVHRRGAELFMHSQDFASVASKQANRREALLYLYRNTRDTPLMYFGW
jgi:hypothetical protein